ncbi:MAG: bifunctional acetate--CoA ligase family protein/GNAT family N-acetyltransferase [Kiloniellales bacterium]|nr:bifunctional acetate--CoA ligase family protein/GNAT family N-acetyltransferase [Kiloniellales bacterium]
MSLRHLERLLKPESIAVVGVETESPSRGANIARNLFHSDFQGPVLPIHPTAKAIEGVLAYDSAESLPIVPDLAVIATPLEQVPDLISAFGARGTRAAVVTTALRAVCARERRAHCQMILEAAKPHDMRIVGPGSLGVMVPSLGLNAGHSPLLPRDGSLALVTQSESLVTALLDWAASRGIGFSHVVALGEMADVDLGDLLDYLALEPKTRAILLELNAIREARKFMSAARGAARVKPVIVLKAGRHDGEAGETAGPIPSHAVYEAAFARAGLLPVRSLSDLAGAAETLFSSIPVSGDRLAIISNGGALARLAVDALLDEGGVLANLPATLFADLGQRQSAELPPVNPIDLQNEATARDYDAALEAVLGSRAADAVLVLHAPSPLSTATEVARTVIAAARGHRKPLLAAWVGGPSVAEARQLFAEHRLASYETPGEAVRAFMHLVRYRRHQAMLTEIPPAIAEKTSPNVESHRAAFAAILGRGRDRVEGAKAMDLLADYGVPAMREGDVKPSDRDRVLTLGMQDHAVFGPALFLGQATAADGLADVAVGLPPLNLTLARTLLAETRFAHLLPGADDDHATLAALAEILMRLGQMTIELPEVIAARIELGIPDAGTVLALDASFRLRALSDEARRHPGRRLAIKPYPKRLERRLRLRDGREILLRPIRPEDAPALKDVFAQLTPEDRRQRFLGTVAELTDSLAKWFTQIDYSREMALIAVNPQAEQTEIWGGVRLVADADNQSAEFAVTVRSDRQGLGLGRILMEAILAHARRQGIVRVWGHVLRDNRGMLALARRLGFAVTPMTDSPGIVEVRLDIESEAA